MTPKFKLRSKTSSKTSTIIKSKLSLLITRQSFFNRHNRDEEAKAFFEQAYQNDRKNLQAYQNLENIKNKMARWHFRMLNDSARNLSFKKAIQFCIRKQGKVHVMDIGSGTGLLSLYAANVASVKTIYAVECSRIMAEMSAEVFKGNPRGKMVTLLTKHSMDLKVGEDIEEKVSLIVSETLDSGVFGEGILDTLIHAKENLLTENGKIVPWKVKIHVAGFKAKSLTMNQILVNDTFHEYLFLHNFRLIAKRDEPYDAEYVDRINDFRIVTNTADTLEVDFNDLQSMQRHFDGTEVKEFQLESEVCNDYLDGFVVWFSLYLNEMEPENVISTKPNSGSCWNQAIFKLHERVLLKKSQILKLAMSCKDGILAVHHELDKNDKKINLEVDGDTLKFLNDDEYLRELEFAVGKHKGTFVNCLDLSPFPYIGLVLLKDGRLKKLWCRKKNEKVIRKIAEKNVVDIKKIEFVEDFANLGEFQLIILHPFHSLGDLNDRVICDYPKYLEALTADGLIIPRKITLFGELINCDWLVESCRVTDIGVKRFKIDKLINSFATEIHLDLDNFLDCEKLTSLFKISEIYFDDEQHEKSFDVPMRNINLPIHAILFHHKIQLTGNTNEFSTCRKSISSCFRRSAQVLASEVLVDSASVKISFLQNSGIVKCDVVS